MFTTPYKEAIADVLNELSAALEADEDQIVTPENYIVTVICKILWGGAGFIWTKLLQGPNSLVTAERRINMIISVSYPPRKQS